MDSRQGHRQRPGKDEIAQSAQVKNQDIAPGKHDHSLVIIPSNFRIYFCRICVQTVVFTFRGKAMAATLIVRDETAGGKTVNELTLDILTEKITVRELIRSRVYQEVQDYNRKGAEHFRGLVQPTGAEQTLNGYKLKTRRDIDWKKQFELACDAFERNGFFIVVDEQQAESLDEEIELEAGTQVSFVKLTPLVGG